MQVIDPPQQVIDLVIEDVAGVISPCLGAQHDLFRYPLGLLFTFSHNTTSLSVTQKYLDLEGDPC
jgi:hypothetical protein